MTQENSTTSNQQKNILIRIVLLVVIAMLVLWNFFFKNDYIIIEALKDNIDTTLADHSHILLKKGSVLTFTKAFNKNNRTVSLFGEAYCDINEDQKFPFIIEGGAATLTSKTSTFDVNSDSAFIIINIKGKLEISTKNKDKLTINVAEGEKITVNAQHTSKELNRSDNYLFWKTSEMVFISKPLETVITEMNLYANAHLSLSDKASDNLRQTIINISFRNQTLDDMVKELCTVAGLKSVKKDGGWLLKWKR
jgi:ferric-dicitrate binding protein FerR (iron transport regulator)